jgi:hypothetical protein
MENSDINYTKIEINCATNTIVEAPMSETEIAEYEADQAAQALKIAEAQAKAAQKAALLDRLGITEDEAKLLLA